LSSMRTPPISTRGSIADLTNRAACSTTQQQQVWPAIRCAQTDKVPVETYIEQQHRPCIKLECDDPIVQGGGELCA
jgi:hypothetical protein